MSQPLYNTRHLARPPSNSLKPAAPANSEDFTEVKAKLQHCIDTMSSLSALSMEHHVLKKLLRRKRNQIRCQKVFRSLSQAAKFVERFTEVNLGNSASELLLAFEGDLCPARQMVEHFLVRLMGVAVLLAETNNFYLKTYLDLYQQLETGHLVPQNLVFLGALSRIRLIACALYLHVVEWYDSVVGRLLLFTPAAFTWLPEDHIFPSQLSEWVGTITPVPSPLSQQTLEPLQQPTALPSQQTPQALPRAWKKEKSLVTRMLEKFAKKPSKKTSPPDQTLDSTVGEEASTLSALDSSAGDAESEKIEESFSYQRHIHPGPDLDEKWECVHRDAVENVTGLSSGEPNPDVDSDWQSASVHNTTVDDLETFEVSAKGKKKKLKQKLLAKKEKFASQKKKLKKTREGGMVGENDSILSGERMKKKKNKKKLQTLESSLLSHNSSGVTGSPVQKKKQKKEKQKKKKNDVNESFTSAAFESPSVGHTAVEETTGGKVTKKKRKKMKKQGGSFGDSSSSSQLLHNQRKAADVRMTKKMKKLMKLKGMGSDLDSLPPTSLNSSRKAKKRKTMKKLMKLAGSSSDVNSANGNSSFVQPNQSTNLASGQKRKKKQRHGHSSISATDSSRNGSQQKKKKKKQKQPWTGSADQSSMSMKKNRKKKGKKRRAGDDGPRPSKKMRTES